MFNSHVIHVNNSYVFPPVLYVLPISWMNVLYVIPPAWICFAYIHSTFSWPFMAFLWPFYGLFSQWGFPGMLTRENGSKVIPVAPGELPSRARLKMQVLKSWTTRHLAMVVRTHGLLTFSQSQHNVKLFNIQLKSFECLLEEFSPIHSPP